MATYKIDPALEEQLKKRGMTNKLTELQGATKNTSTVSNFLPSLGSTIVNAPGNILKGIDSVVDTGIPTLGNAYGGALLAKSGYVDKMQNELTRTNQDLGDKVIKQIRDPKVSDSAKAKLVNMYRDINPDIASQIPQLQVTDKEILGSSAKLAMFVALAGSSPMSPAGKVKSFSYVNPAVNKELLSLTNAAKNLTKAERWVTYGPKIGEAINVAEKFGPQMAYDALLGVTYGAGNAFGKNKSIEEVKKEAADMGALNAGIPLVGGMVLRGLSQGLKYAGEGIGGLTMKARNAAEKYALGTTLEERAIAAKTVQEEMLAINKPQQTGTQKLAEGFVKGVDWIRDIPRQMLDAGIPLNKYSRDAYLDYREGADRVNNRTKKSQLDIVDIFSKDNNILDAQKAKMNLLDQLDIARQGKETASQRLYGAATPEETVKILEQKQIEMELAHQDAGILEEVQIALDKYTDFNTKLLQDKVDHGLITQESMDEMLTQHPNYIPHNTVVRSLDENVVMGTSGSKNPSKSGVMSSEGSTRELDDPIDTIFNRLEGHYKSIENAKLTNDLIKDAPSDLFTVVESEADHVTKKKLAEEYHGLVVDLKKKFKEFSTNNKFGKKVTTKFNDIQENIKVLSNDLEEELSAYLSGVKIKEVKPTVTVTGFKTPGAKYSRLIDTVNELNTAGKSRKEIEDALMKDNEFFKLYETGALESEGFNTVDNFIEGSLKGKTSFETGEKTVVRNAKKGVVTDLNKQIASLRDTMESVGIKKETMDEYIDIIKNQIEAIKGKKLDIKEQFKALKNNTDLSTLALQEKGLAPINRWVNGFKETYMVPKEVATTIKNLDPEPLHKFVQGWGKINNVFKQLTTGLNLPFGVNNLVKDRQTAYITVSSLIKDAQKRAGISDGFMKKIGMDDKGLLDMYRDIGGSGASIFNDAKGKTGLETFEQMRKSGFATSLEGLRPDKMIENINQQMEISTRLAAFRRALEGGLSPEEAALVARDATVDFSKMGVQMKWLNQVVPFLNARVQGTANTLKAISKNPMDFARKMYYTSVVPTLMLDRHNSQFESNNLVNPEFAKNNWYIITGEEEITDADGRKIKVPTVAGVKKGEMQQLFSAPIDEMLSRSRGNNPKTAGELAYNMLGSISPLGTGGYNPDSWYTAPIAALGPIPKIMVGMGTNIDPYTGLPIEPDTSVEGNLSPKNRYSANTKQLSKELAATIMPGLSPARLEYIIGSWGAVPKQILETANLTEGLIKGEGVRKQNNLTSDASAIPWLNNFIKQGSYVGSTPYKEGRKTEQEIKRETGDINFQNKEKANILIDQAFKIQDPEERKIFLQTAAKNYSPDIITKAATEYKSRNAEGYLRPGMDADVVAQFVYKELLNMQQANTSDAEQKDYLQGLYKKKIISDSAAEKIKGLRQYGEYVGPISEAQTQDEKNTLIISAIYDMKDKGIKNSAASMFLSKMFNDGHITNETLPLIKNAVMEMNKQSE